MKIEVIKQVFGGETQYKYKPIKYCCEELKNNEYINLENEISSNTYCYRCDIGNCDDCEHNENEDECGRVLAMMMRYDDAFPEPWENFYSTNTYYFPIKFCPFCGESIEVVVVGEEDKTEEYLELRKQLEDVRKKIRKNDSKKKEAELEKLSRELSNKIEEFHILSEYKENK